MRDSASTDLLRRSPLFSGLDAPILKAVLDAAQARELPAGATLFDEGDPGSYLFIVAAGQLEALKRSPEGLTRLRTLGVGEVGGLTSMSRSKRRSATLRAATDARVLTVPKPRFVELLRLHPALAESLIDVLSEKVRGRTAQISELLAASGQRASTVAVFDAKPYDRLGFDRLAHERIDFDYFEANLNPATAPLADAYPVVCAFVNDVLSRPTLDTLAAGGTKLIALRCAGYNNVDLEAARELGLTVVRVPAYSPHAVAEHAVALILTLNRKTHRAYNRVREGNFSLNGLVGFDLHGRTAGVVGLGKIGRCLAEILLGFGMHVLAYDAYPDRAYAEARGVELVGLDDLLAASDVVSLHTPLLPDTYHMIDAARLSLMKPGALLINTSRGGLVDAAALIDALKRGVLGGAGLDVYEEESEYFFEDRSDQVITDDLLARLLTFPNVIVTSHQGFLTEEALANIARTTVDNIRAFLAGHRGDALANRVP